MIRKTLVNFFVFIIRLYQACIYHHSFLRPCCRFHHPVRNTRLTRLNCTDRVKGNILGAKEFYAAIPCYPAVTTPSSKQWNWKVLSWQKDHSSRRLSWAVLLVLSNLFCQTAHAPESRNAATGNQQINKEKATAPAADTDGNNRRPKSGGLAVAANRKRRPAMSKWRHLIIWLFISTRGAALKVFET